MLFEKENIDTADMTDEMMITIMGGLAQEESVSISKNLKWSYQKRFEKGIVNVFSAPFGFKLNNGALQEHLSRRCHLLCRYPLHIWWSPRYEAL